MPVSPPLFYSCVNCSLFFKNPVLNYLEKATPLTHPQRHYRDHLFWCHWTNETKCLINVLLVVEKSVSCNSLWFLKIDLRMKSILNYWICWKEELLPCGSNVMFQISWLRIMETMKVVMMWALLQGCRILCFQQTHTKYLLLEDW